MSLPLPNTIIAGAQKSGTTSLCALLSLHPDCFVSTPKEPHFFSGPLFRKGLEGYSKIFIGSEGKKIVTEGSTSYMPSATAISRMEATLGKDTKFVFILRSPTQRAYSAYLHAAQRPSEFRSAEDVFLGLPHESYEAAISVEQMRLEHAYKNGGAATKPYRVKYDDPQWPHRYIRNTFYSHQVEAYQQAFGQTHLHVVIFENLIRNPHVVLAELAKFLEIDPKGFPEEIPRENATDDRYARLTPSRLLINLRQFLRKGRSIRHGMLDATRFPPAPPPSVVAELAEIFRPEVDYWSQHFDTDLRKMGWR